VKFKKKKKEKKNRKKINMMCRKHFSFNQSFSTETLKTTKTMKIRIIIINLKEKDSKLRMLILKLT
jgi:hypothetical protein